MDSERGKLVRDCVCVCVYSLCPCSPCIHLFMPGDSHKLYPWCPARLGRVSLAEEVGQKEGQASFFCFLLSSYDPALACFSNLADLVGHRAVTASFLVPFTFLLPRKQFLHSSGFSGGHNRKYFHIHRKYFLKQPAPSWSPG